MASKDLAKLARHLERDGWQVHPTRSGRLKWQRPDGKVGCYTAQTPDGTTSERATIRKVEKAVKDFLSGR